MKLTLSHRLKIMKWECLSVREAQFLHESSKEGSINEVSFVPWFMMLDRDRPELASLFERKTYLRERLVTPFHVAFVRLELVMDSAVLFKWRKLCKTLSTDLTVTIETGMSILYSNGWGLIKGEIDLPFVWPILAMGSKVLLHGLFRGEGFRAGFIHAFVKHRFDFGDSKKE